MIIYKATNIINGKVYVGQTIHSLEKRKNQHERAYRYSHSKDFIFSRAIRKYGKENFTWEIIDTSETLEELNQKEEMWILRLNSLASSGFGYNEKRGGNNHLHSERTKIKISRSQKGKLSHMYGKVGRLNPRSKRVININTGEIYESANICAKELGLSFSHICSVCRGTRGSAGNFVFRYVDSNDNIIVPDKATEKRDIKKIVNVNTGEIFDNCKKAVESIGYKVASNLSNKLKSGNGVCYFANTLWKYENVDDEVVKKYIKPIKNKPQKSQMKKVKNVTEGIEFESISEASKSKGAKSYSYLALLLKNGDGKCRWKNNEWKIVE